MVKLFQERYQCAACNAVFACPSWECTHSINEETGEISGESFQICPECGASDIDGVYEESDEDV